MAEIQSSPAATRDPRPGLWDACKYAAEDLAQAWSEEMAERFGPAHEHFKLRVNGDRIRIDCLSGEAFGWHRLLTLKSSMHEKHRQLFGYPVEVRFD